MGVRGVYSRRSSWIFAVLFAGSLAFAAEEGKRAPDLPAGWLDQVERQIRASEYHFSLREDGAWSAPNRAHGLRVKVASTGIVLTSRAREGDEGDGGWTLGLALARWGRSGAMHPVEEARCSAQDNRTELARDTLTEWYVNSDAGLKQGFTIDSAPEAGPRRGPLVLEMEFTSDLGVFPSEDGQAVIFKTGQGEPVLRYAGLQVTDSTGAEVPARIAFVAGRLQIRIDDDDAVYPLEVDPLMTSPAWTAESNQVSANFGRSVATAGDVNGDGYSDVVVGAWLYDNVENDEGRAFLYLGSAAGLAASPAWTAESNQEFAFFGISVATAGDVNGDGYSDVVVGALYYANVERGEGRAFLYLGSGSGLAASPAWTAESNQASAFFGYSVATAGDVNGDGYSDVVVGAWLYDNGESDEGRAFLYLGSAAGLAASPAWTAESNQANAYFGYSVATAGDVNGDGYSDVVVGAWLYDNVEGDEGRAFLYLGSGSGLAASPAWTAESNQANAYFGISVATAGDVNGDGYSDVVVGADSYDNVEGDEGRAFLYLGSAAGLAASPAWTAESNQANANFGISVATAGDVNGDGYADVVVGADSYDNVEGDEGRAFLYLGSASGLAASPAWTAESNQANAEFGRSVATAGDVNGDGYSDVVVGAYAYDNGESNEGRAFLYLGSAAGLAASPAWTAESNQANANFGISVATAGDVNGDGYSDVVVGADSYDNGETDEGRAFLYVGSASGLAASPAWTAESNQANAGLGFSVATAGDVNGDGYSDVVVGATGYSNVELGEGRAFLYLGSASGLAASPAWTAESNQASDLFGYSVAAAGDVNGDGYSDVVVGAYGYDNGETDEGRAFLYVGSASGLAASPAWTAESNQANAGLGFSVATAGDVNGDGYSDVVVGAWLYDNGQTNEGRAFLYLGSAAGLAASPAWTAESNQFFAYFGVSVATAGDVNCDGYSDVVVGAWLYDNVELGEGRAFLYLGSAAGLAASPAWTAESNQVSARFGISVATAGDVNGDGYSDVVVGAYGYDNGESNEGRAFLYLGNDGPGLSLKPQQRRVSDAAPIDHLGVSDDTDGFRLALTGRSPYGRTRVKLEWEVKPLGVPLDGTALERSASWIDSGTAGAALDELASGLLAGAPQHWRVRLLYEPAGTPYQQHSRWLDPPWAGWNEAMLRTPPGEPGGSVPASGGTPLLVARATGGQITLSWGASCAPSDTDYEIYEGTLGSFYSHSALYCSTGGATTKTFTPAAGATYYLVVPRNGPLEGSYGLRTGDIERPAGLNACLAQLVAPCP